VSESVAGHRNTANTRLVLDALRDSDSFRSAQQIYLDIRRRAHPRIALASVYRILHALTVDQVAETQRAENGEALYRLRCDAEHHHYLLCRLCGAAVAFTPTALEEHANALIRQHRYRDVTHRIDLYGTCPRCSSAPI
jgi:Fur family transcriptional regulator, ferric uptake regulator